MSDAIWFPVLIAVSYLCGSIPSGYLIGKAYGKDVRKEGSGNIGATNVTRVVGKVQGKICFACDFLKGLAPVLAAVLLVHFGTVKDSCGILPGFCAFAAVAGHMWPVWLGFKGGKGISTAAGALGALCWPAVVFAILVWVIVFKASGYVSLGSIAAAIALPAAAAVCRVCGIPPDVSNASLALMVLLTVIAVIRHRSNIRRLLDGTENRFTREKK